MVHVLIINLERLGSMLNTVCSVRNLEFYQIPYTIIHANYFDTIDFSKYTHILLTGSTLIITNNQLALSKKQIQHLVQLRIPILAQCYGFQLLAYHLCSHDSVKILPTKHTSEIPISSPILDPSEKYFFNHINYVDHLDNRWTIISKKTILDSDGSRITFIADAIHKEYPILCLQYHPEKNKSTYNFYLNWIIKSNNV